MNDEKIRRSQFEMRGKKAEVRLLKLEGVKLKH